MQENARGGVPELKKALLKHLSQVELARTPWPRSWFRVKEKVREKNLDFLEVRQFVEICEQEKIIDEGKQKILIRYLHDLGLALQFEDPRLQLVQILNPRWATQAVYRIINAPELAAGHGILDLAHLAKILKKTEPDHFLYPPDKHLYIVDLMKKFELCYELPGGNILTPDQLEVGEPSITFPTKNILRFRYEYDFLPRSILPRFIVRRHEEIDGLLRWRSGVVVKNKETGARAVVKADVRDRRITVEVEGHRRREYFASLRMTFRDIHDSFQKLSVREMVPLPRNPAHAVAYQDLLFHEEKERATILVGEIKVEESVRELLDGIEEESLRRQQRRESASPASPVTIHYHDKVYGGDDMSDSITATVGNNNKDILIGKNINQATAEKIEGSFNRAADATNKPDEVRNLLKQLAQEIAKVVEKLPKEKAESVANDLDTLTKEATSAAPRKKWWELSKEGIIEAAQAAGAVGTTAIALLAQLSPLLGF